MTLLAGAPSRTCLPRQLCTFEVSGESYGVDVLDVREVVRSQPLTPVPRAPQAVRGLLNLRGEIVLAIDLRTVLVPGSSGSPDPVNLVVSREGGVVSLLVDDVGDVLDADPERFAPAPEPVQARTAGLTPLVYRQPASLLLVLDARATAEAVLQPARRST
jgi:purine-binding chemotaxis protein CheW